MEANNKIISLLKDSFSDAIAVLANDYQASSFNDIFITVDKESGEVSFYDDEENCIETIVIDRWINQPELQDEKIASVLRAVVEELDDNDGFASLDIYKPFSISYADENMEVIEELLLIEDDASIHTDNDLLERFDKEFDDFLDKLLKE